MKILTGALRGQPIVFSANPHLRPTSDKVRQAIFNTLKDVVGEAEVLDLFSGTGALGFEALSMGAARVVFAEKDKRQAQKIEDNLERLKLTDRARVYAIDALEAIERFEKKEKFDLIFLDPPYYKGLAQASLEKLGVSPILKDGAIVMAEGHAEETFSQQIGSLELLKLKTYGDTQIAIYRHA